MKKSYFDYSKHSLDDLYGCLEGIDDKQYPTRALEIYLRILKHLQMENKYPTSEELGYKENTFWEHVIDYMMSWPGDILLADQDLLRNQMREKIDRLNNLRKAEEYLSPA
jgi:hypothetical protein